MWGSFRRSEKYGIGGVVSIAVELPPVQELTKLPPSRTLKIGRCGGSGSIAALLREIIARFSKTAYWINCEKTFATAVVIMACTWAKGTIC